MFCESDNENEDSDAMIKVRTKRTLPTIVSTPERSPLQKKVPKIVFRGTIGAILNWGVSLIVE